MHARGKDQLYAVPLPYLLHLVGAFVSIELLLCEDDLASVFPVGESSAYLSRLLLLAARQTVGGSALDAHVPSLSYCLDEWVLSLLWVDIVVVLRVEDTIDSPWGVDRRKIKDLAQGLLSGFSVEPSKDNLPANQVGRGCST